MNRLWDNYAFARAAFDADKSPRNYGIVVATYAGFVRAYCPAEANGLISHLCATLQGVAADAA